jgi:DNA helicase IV
VRSHSREGANPRDRGHDPPEQDAIVRSNVGKGVCVQEVRAKARLPRSAWLVYAFRKRLAHSGVLVIGQNRAFLDHIGAVLPTLGRSRSVPAQSTLLARCRVAAGKT